MFDETQVHSAYIDDTKCVVMASMGGILVRLKVISTGDYWVWAASSMFSLSLRISDKDSENVLLAITKALCGRSHGVLGSISYFTSKIEKYKKKGV